MQIPFNDFKKQYKKYKRKIDSALNRVLESGFFILGKETDNFERKFAEYIGSKHAIGVANGLEALKISLLALGIKSGDEIITTSHSAVATALAIKAVGATPVFADIDDFYHIDASKIEQNITANTKAIIPVHLYGQPADINEICLIAKKHGLYVIEDCAQAHGAKYKNKKVGTFGTFGCFSFYPTKNLGAFGDAGAIVTDDSKLADKCRALRNYGQKNRYEHELYGINSRLDEIHSAILGVLLPDLDKNNLKRKLVSETYRKELSAVKEIKLPKERKNINHVYHLFVIEAQKRNELIEHLKSKGIASLIHYPIPIHKQKCFTEHNSLSLPIIESKVDIILSLPIHPFLSIKEVRFICKEIKNFYAKNN